MTILKVRVHWTDISNPVPTPIGVYGTPPIMPSPPPPWSSSRPGPVDPKEVYKMWCPLVPQDALENSHWGKNTVPPLPPAWPTGLNGSGAPRNTYDQGWFGVNVADFKVTALRLWQDGMGDFTYTITAPNGFVIGTITPTVSGWTTIPLAPPIASGKGIWLVDIDRAASSSVGAPSLLRGTPSVYEPYVSPYGNNEGILGLEFTGEEIMATPPRIITPSVSIGQCDVSGRKPSTLKITFNPPLPIGTSYKVTWRTSVAPKLDVRGTVTITPLQFLETPASYIGGQSYFPSADVEYTIPGAVTVRDSVDFATGSAAGTVDVDQCPPPPSDQLPNCSVTVSGPINIPCTDSFPTSLQTFTATPPTNFLGTSYSWEVKKGGSKIYGLVTGKSFKYAFQGPGIYTVLVSINTKGICAEESVSGNFDVEILRCTPDPQQDCPKGYHLGDNGKCEKDTVKDCPKGYHLGDDGTCKEDTVKDCPEGYHLGDDGTCKEDPKPTTFSWCCFLIIAWMIVNAIFGVMLYYGVPSMWPVGTIISIVVGAIATILLGIWLFLCCGKCALKFWRCCVLWQWQFIGVSWICTIFGLLEAASKWVPILGGNGLVLGIYSTLAGAIALILAIAECGRLPNPFDPSTWPACCCSEGKCI